MSVPSDNLTLNVIELSFLLVLIKEFLLDILISPYPTALIDSIPALLLFIFSNLIVPKSPLTVSLPVTSITDLVLLS